MTTSGSIDLSLTASQVIEYALRKINILAEAQSASSEATDRALTELEVMLKEWMPYPAIWRLTEGSITLVADTQSYTPSPVPYRIVDMRYRDANSHDIPMFELTRQEYFDIPLKSSSGIPTSWYLDAQRASSTLYVWPLLSSVTTETLRYTYQRKIEDIDDTDNEIDVGQEHLSTVLYYLAAWVADF